jgi:hypothetical protein
MLSQFQLDQIRILNEKIADHQQSIAKILATEKKPSARAIAEAAAQAKFEAYNRNRQRKMKNKTLST